MRNKTSVIWKISKEDLCEVVNQSTSFRAVLKALGLGKNGNSVHILKQRLSADEIDCTQLILARIAKHKNNFSTIGTVKPLEEVLVENSTYSRATLKKRLIKLELLKNECYECGQLPIWNNKPLVMVLDHINGINNDNRLKNLRLLCPHCNSQTSTFAGRNNLKIRSCKICGKRKRFKTKSPLCLICGKHKLRKVSRPTALELKELVWLKPTTQVAQSFGVSDSCIKKWCRFYGIKKPPRGYWNKVYAGKIEVISGPLIVE